MLTPKEIQRLLIHAKEDGCYELLLLELSTGLRRSEICALQWDDLNLRTRVLRVERQVHRVGGELVTSPPKTKVGNRSVILPAPVLRVLKEYKKPSTPGGCSPRLSKRTPPEIRPPSESDYRLSWNERDVKRSDFTTSDTHFPLPL